MTTYFVASGGSNTSPYDTWAKAATSLQTALTAASTAGDIVVIQYDAVPAGDSESSTGTFTFAADITLISASNDGGSAYTPTAMGDASWIGTSGTNRNITVAGAYSLYIFGVTFRSASATVATMQIGITGKHRILESCTFWVGNTNVNTKINLCAVSNIAAQGFTKATNCIFRFASTSQGIGVGGGSRVELVGCSLHASTTTPTNLFRNEGTRGSVSCEGCDFSLAGANAVPGSILNTDFTFINCDVPVSFVWLSTQSVTNLSSAHVWVFNCASGDTHYDFGYYNAIGSIVSTTAKYASGGAKFDGTNGVSWQIDTTAYATFDLPFVTPWIDLYHSGTSAITPSLEILRDGSATAYDNDEVWAEFSYQGTSGSTKATFVDDKMALGGTPAAQTTGNLGAGDWTGEGGTAWFGKLNPASAITPAEIGMLRARVCVGLASATVYVDPYIRVA